jgi:hypothetical protein
VAGVDFFKKYFQVYPMGVDFLRSYRREKVFEVTMSEKEGMRESVW